jgi:hypothetical protein
VWGPFHYYYWTKRENIKQIMSYTGAGAKRLDMSVNKGVKVNALRDLWLEWRAGK